MSMEEMAGMHGQKCLQLFHRLRVQTRRACKWRIPQRIAVRRLVLRTRCWSYPVCIRVAASVRTQIQFFADLNAPDAARKLFMLLLTSTNRTPADLTKDFVIVTKEDEELSKGMYESFREALRGIGEGLLEKNPKKKKLKMSKMSLKQSKIIEKVSIFVFFGFIILLCFCLKVFLKKIRTSQTRRKF